MSVFPTWPPTWCPSKRRAAGWGTQKKHDRGRRTDENFMNLIEEKREQLEA
jgi:hypothetical protein